MKDIHFKYLVSGEREDLWGLAVTMVGSQQVRPHAYYPQAEHPTKYLFAPQKGRVLEEYALLYISHGSGTFSSTSQQEIHLKAGHMVLLFPNEWHTYHPNPDTGWEEYWIGFKGKQMDERVKNNFFRKQSEVYFIGVNLSIIQLYKQAIAMAIKQPMGYQQTLASIADLILTSTISMAQSANDDYAQVNRQINQAKAIIYERFHTELNAQAIAAEVCMSYSWFRHMFKEHTGLSPNQYAQELRIQKSKELLISTALTCQEIAYRVGYENPIYFGIIFKKKTGMTPTEYRKLYQPQ